MIEQRREDIQVMEAVIHDGKPSIRIHTERGEERKHTRGTNLEIITMTPAAAMVLGRTLYRMGKALE